MSYANGVVYDDEVNGRIIWVGDKVVKSSPNPDWFCTVSIHLLVTWGP